ncbi:MAG: DUF1501 domain-containing protein, partial [Planctomycetales bacterium]|nr:DUF1501 domain-containing protein [Planctomycetales bacterium]
LGPKYNPLIVENSAGSRPNGDNPNTYAELKVDAMSPPTDVDPARLQRRLQMWKRQEDRYLRDHPHGNALMHGEVYNAAIDLMNSPAGRVFDLSQEPAALRDKYGRGVFGQGCLLARRLIEEGVPCIEVSLGGSADGVGWDTHADNFATVQRLSAELDAGWSSLLSDLHERGLLETTTILWMGEFGRTPKINNNAGRDHFPQAWTC